MNNAGSTLLKANTWSNTLKALNLRTQLVQKLSLDFFDTTGQGVHAAAEPSKRGGIILGFVNKRQTAPAYQGVQSYGIAWELDMAILEAKEGMPDKVQRAIDHIMKNLLLKSCVVNAQPYDSGSNMWQQGWQQSQYSQSPLAHGETLTQAERSHLIDMCVAEAQFIASNYLSQKRASSFLDAVIEIAKRSKLGVYKENGRIEYRELSRDFSLEMLLEHNEPALYEKYTAETDPEAKADMLLDCVNTCGWYIMSDDKYYDGNYYSSAEYDFIVKKDSVTIDSEFCSEGFDCERDFTWFCQDALQRMSVSCEYIYQQAEAFSELLS